MKERVVDKAGFKLVFVNCRRVRASQWKKAVEEYNIEVAQEEKIFWAGTGEEENVRTGEDGRSLRNSTAFKILMKRDDSYFEWSEVPPRKRRNILDLLDSTLADPFKNPVDSSKRSPKLVFPSFNEDEIYRSLDVAPRSQEDKAGSRRGSAKGKRARESEYSTESESEDDRDHSPGIAELVRDHSPGIAELVRGLRSFEQRLCPPSSSARVDSEDDHDTEDYSHNELPSRLELAPRSEPPAGGEDHNDVLPAGGEDQDNVLPAGGEDQDNVLPAGGEDRNDAELPAGDEDRGAGAGLAANDGYEDHVQEIAPPPAAVEMVSLSSLSSFFLPLLQSNVALQNALMASNEKLVAGKDEVIVVKDMLISAKDNVIAARDELISVKDMLISAKNEVIAAKDKAIAANNERFTSITESLKEITTSVIEITSGLGEISEMVELQTQSIHLLG